MVLGDVSLGDLLWSLLVIFFMVSYFLILFQVIVDVFRRDASGANKALWLLFLLVAPVIALIAYMIVNGEGMARRRMGDVAAAQDRQTDDYIRSVAGGAAVRRRRSRAARSCWTRAQSRRTSSPSSKPVC